MPDQMTTPHTPSARRVKRRGQRPSAAFALALLIACVPFAQAQKRARRPQSPVAKKPVAAQQGKSAGDAKGAGTTDDATGKAVGSEAVRERRATAPQVKTGPEDEPRVVSEATEDVDDAPAPAGAARDGSGLKDDSATWANVDEELAAARSKINEEKSDAVRARLRRAYVERLVALERRAEAVAELRAMLAEERFDPPYFYNAGNALARLGESGAAVEGYRKAISQRRGNYSRAQHNLGVMLMRQGRWEEAQEALKAALRLENYNYAEASYNLGRLYALRGEAGPAINEWTRTLRLQPDHVDAAIALARALAEDGDPEQAINTLDTFSKRFERRGTGVPRAIEIARGELVAARNLDLETETTGSVVGVKSASVEKDAADSSAKTVRASDLKANYREARTPSTAALRTLTVDRQTYDLLQRARAAREGGRDEEAVTLYNRVLRSRGGYFPPANLELGYALGSLQRNEEAIATLLLVTKKDGARYPIAFYHLGRAFENLGQLDRAGENFSRAVNFFGDANPQFLLDLSRVREKEGKWDDALAAMESYAQTSERLGATPEWLPERIARLRQKTSATTTATPVK